MLYSPMIHFTKINLFFNFFSLFLKKPQTLVHAVHVRIFSPATKHEINKIYNIILKT